MAIPRFVAWILPIGLLALDSGAVCGQAYPSKTIRITTGGVDGSSDISTRLIAQGMSDLLGQPVIVDNRPFEVMAIELVAKAPPDGYTLMIIGSTFWVGPLLRKVSYDPVSDFSAISLTAKTPNILAVHPALPVKSVKELIALAKARPGELNYSLGAVGGSPQIAAELFKSMAGVKIVGVPFGTASARMAALLGGEVQLEFTPIGVVQPHLQSGRLRALAVTSVEPSALVPGLPTVADAGLPGYECVTIGGMLAPAKTPETIVNRLNQGLVRFLNMAETKRKFLSTGLQPASSSPEEFVAIMKSEKARVAKVINDAGIRVE